MHLIGRRFAVLIVCAQMMTWACGTRTGAAGIPASPQEAPPPAVPAPAPVVEARPVPPPAAAPITAETRPDGCALLAQPGDSIAIVGLTERVDPSHAPRPSNDSERVVFRQLYETLVRVDCMGRVIPGLAASWRLDGDGRTWMVTLREHAQFSDGIPITPADVRASWRDGSGDELRPDVRRLIQSIEPAGERTLAIRLQRPRVDVPLALAHSDLAIAKSVANSAWPVGTRLTRIAPESDTVTTTLLSAIAITRDNLPSVKFLVAPADPRDLIDHGVDLLLTRNSAALDYAGTLPNFQIVPLAWQRTHVLVTPGRSRSSMPLSDEQRQALADDAVRGEARGARGPFWWQMIGDCEVATPSSRRQALPTPRIVYDANDGAARDLSERFVGLSRASGAVATAFLDALFPDRSRRAIDRASGLTGEPLALAKRLGSDVGYVISVDSRPLDPCRDLQELIEGARWIDPETMVPLVDTRLHAIVRRGRGDAIVDWDGGMVIADTHTSR
ncbi:MAG TPA: ABC transporter substrate-binding protein [Vicinamibacterales bacterium]